MIKRVLSRLEPSPHAIFADDGKTALRALGLDGTRNGKASIPRLILLDIKMPMISGLEVLAKVRQDERFSTVPIVMLTSSDDPDDVEAARTLGATGYVVKSLDLTQFNDVLTRVVLYFLGRSSERPVARCCLFLD